MVGIRTTARVPVKTKFVSLSLLRFGSNNIFLSSDASGRSTVDMRVNWFMNTVKYKRGHFN